MIYSYVIIVCQLLVLYASYGQSEETFVASLNSGYIEKEKKQVDVIWGEKSKPIMYRCEDGSYKIYAKDEGDRRPKEQVQFQFKQITLLLDCVVVIHTEEKNKIIHLAFNTVPKATEFYEKFYPRDKEDQSYLYELETTIAYVKEKRLLLPLYPERPNAVMFAELQDLDNLDKGHVYRIVIKEAEDREPLMVFLSSYAQMEKGPKNKQLMLVIEEVDIYVEEPEHYYCALIFDKNHVQPFITKIGDVMRNNIIPKFPRNLVRQLDQLTTRDTRARSSKSSAGPFRGQPKDYYITDFRPKK